MTTYIPNAGPNLSSKRGWLRRRWGWWAGAVAVCVLAAGAYIFFAKPGQAQSRTAKPGQAQSTGKPGQNAGARSVPVAATAAKTGDVGVYLSGLGSVTPLNTVTVKSRVDGQLMRVVFREGQVVRAGDLLAEIDPRPFQVQLEQAVPVDAFDRAGAAHLASGKVLTVDNEIDHGAAARQDERGARPAGHQAGTSCPLGPRDDHDR